MMDRTEDGRQIRLADVIDEYTRESLPIEVARSSAARDVILTLKYMFAVRGAPHYINSDNGPKFIAKELQTWLSQAAARTLYIQKASPSENGNLESCHSRLRDELLNRELFLSLDDAKFVLDLWRSEYNQQ